MDEANPPAIQIPAHSVTKWNTGQEEDTLGFLEHKTNTEKADHNS